MRHPILDDRFTLDEHQSRKQPDWTYDEPRS